MMKSLQRSLRTHLHFQSAKTIFACFAAGFDFLQVLFQHYEHCALPLQLFEFYGGASGSEQE